jgi:chitin synthase
VKGHGHSAFRATNTSATRSHHSHLFFLFLEFSHHVSLPRGEYSLWFNAQLSVYSGWQADEGQQGHNFDGYSPYPPTSHYDQPNYAPDPFSTPQDYQNYPQHTQEYQPNYPPVGHDPFNPPYTQSPSPNHPESYPSSSYTLAPPSAQEYQQQQPLGSLTPDQSFGATDLTVPPPLSNQTSTTAFQPYEDLDHELDDMGDLPLLRAPSGGRPKESISMNMPGQYGDRSQESLSMNMPGQYGGSPDDIGIRYGRIPQRVPRRYKTLKRIECVSRLSHLHTMSAHPLLSLFVTQALPRQFCA